MTTSAKWTAREASVQAADDGHGQRGRRAGTDYRVWRWSPAPLQIGGARLLILGGVTQGTRSRLLWGSGSPALNGAAAARPRISRPSLIESRNIHTSIGPNRVDFRNYFIYVHGSSKIKSHHTVRRPPMTRTRYTDRASLEADERMMTEYSDNGMEYVTRRHRHARLDFTASEEILQHTDGRHTPTPPSPTKALPPANKSSIMDAQ